MCRLIRCKIKCHILMSQNIMYLLQERQQRSQRTTKQGEQHFSTTSIRSASLALVTET